MTVSVSATSIGSLPPAYAAPRIDSAPTTTGTTGTRTCSAFRALDSSHTAITTAAATTARNDGFQT